jgi:hypothetical protein
LQSLGLDSYVLQEEDERRRERFAASSVFPPGFERHQVRSLRTPHHKRHSALDEIYADYFVRKLNSLSNDYPPELIFNMDEACWPLFEAPPKDLAEKGWDIVKLESTTGEKTSFTALGAISRANQKLPLCVLAKWQNVHRERKFGHHLSAFRKCRGERKLESWFD